MIDELFGELEYKLGFNGKTKISLFEKEWDLRLKINTDEDEIIKPSQRKVFSEYLENKDEIMNEVEDKIFDYYLSVFEEYRAMREEDKDKVAPIICDKNELAKLIEPITLLIDYDFEDGSAQRWGFVMETIWEPSHGLGVLIQNKEVTKVGYADVIL